MLKRFPLFFLLSITGISLVYLFADWRTADEPDQVYIESFKKQYGIYAIPMPDSLFFAGEEVPMGLQDIRERYDRELLVNTYWQSQTMLFFKRANRWFPVIEPILESHGVPNDFKYLALIESGLMNVVSPAGATGFWQILEGTGRELGLEVNARIDERYHVEKATAAACQYLLDAKSRFGSWTLAAAAYNMGNARLTRVLHTQRSSNYYDLHLNEETARYMFRILAVKTIFSDPQGSGFHFREEDLYPPHRYKTVVVDTTVSDLVDFALRNNTTYRNLKVLNPWLRDYELPNRSGRYYEIKIPDGGTVYDGMESSPDSMTTDQNTEPEMPAGEEATDQGTLPEMPIDEEEEGSF